ncbi:hypothetical protein AYO39_00455 [Actinobacteria bacterium SCGC AG-212-D09]|nr:hypothetical protein AYO39_00455 [Actinobacteria bacterium SCGC AG-212-D09]
MDQINEALPVWTLGSEVVELPPGFDGVALSPERLSELRALLAALSDKPVAVLEAHPRPAGLDRSSGIVVDSVSPLARGLSTVVAESSKALANAPKAVASGEALYRMVVPAKFAERVSQGLVRSMRSRAVSGGVRGQLVGAKGIEGGASFVPVTGAAVAGGGLAAVAGPLILVGITVGLSAYADYRQQQAIRELSTLLKRLDKDNLDRERAELEGCHDAIATATSLVLDEAVIGHGVGFDSAVNDIDTAVSRARQHLQEWKAALEKMPRRDGRVEVHKLIEVLPGIDKGGGEFQAHLELAALAIAFKRRVTLLQALDHAQLNPNNRFERFAHRMKEAAMSVDELEAGIREMLLGVASLELTPPRRFFDRVAFTPREVRSYLRTIEKARELSAAVDVIGGRSDVAIEMARDADGSVTVFPALPA